MILSQPATDAAFRQLVAALESETNELNQLGTRVALAGNPKNAQKLMRLAGERAKFRDHVKFLHKEWEKPEPIGIRNLQVTSEAAAVGEARPVTPLSRKTKGLTLAQAAAKLGVRSEKVQGWLDAGTLKGYRRVSGTWKILQTDLVEFYRQHRDLF